MRLNRVYAEQALAVGGEVALPEAAAYHVARVLRLRAGAPLVLFDGSGTDFRAEIVAVEGDRVRPRIVERSPGLPGDAAFTDPEKSRALADTFYRTAERLEPLGMACGFHNHEGEFKTHEGKTWWDLFAVRTTPDVILQQDCGWSATAGLDPAALVTKHPGRTKSTHFKPVVLPRDAQTRKPFLGEDSVDWAGVYAACRAVGGTEWIIVEQETYPDGRSSTDCTRQSLAGLRKILAGATRG